MTVPASSSAQQKLELAGIEPSVLVEITSASGTLYFCNNRAVTVDGNTYQPYLLSMGTLRVAGSYPENNTSSKELQLEFLNDPVEYEGTLHPHLSQTFSRFDWEQADCNVSVLLTASGQTNFPQDDSIPLVASGTLGSPQKVQRSSFEVAVVPRNIKLNDLIPSRVITQDDFPEADPAILNGRTYLPIVIGESVRVTALSTTAGATTTVRTQVSTGTTLEVSDTTGFSNGDSLIIAGFTGTSFTIGTVDSASNRFTGLSPNLSTLGVSINVGDQVVEDKANYDYTIANHSCGNISQVFVDDVLIDPAKYSKQNVSDGQAIDGTRTDLRIAELIPFGAETSATGNVTDQPTTEVDNANHDHNVGVTGQNTETSFAGGISPGGAAAGNDGNENTFFTLNISLLTATYNTFSSKPGTFVEQRYFTIINNAAGAGDTFQLRRGTTVFFSIVGVVAKGEFRSSTDTGGSDTSTFNAHVTPSSATFNCYESWKEVTMSPAVSEDLVDLTSTTRTQDVAISVSATGANKEVGRKVEVVIDGLQSPDVARFGTGTVNRPDYIMRWFIEEVLGQTSDIVNLDSHASAGAKYASESFTLAFAIQQPIRLDALFDQIAQQAKSLHFWGRNGHTLVFIPEVANLPEAVASYVEDSAGTTSIEWRNSISAADLRNKLVANFSKRWTRVVDKDESYAGTVEAENLGSQERFGVLSNEVTSSNGTDKALFFDYIPSETHAQTVLDFVVEQKSEPREEFEVTSSDWAQILREPGDLVEVRTPTLLTPARCLVLEANVDPLLRSKLLVRRFAGAS